MDRLYIIGIAIVLIAIAGVGGGAYGWHLGSEAKQAEITNESERHAASVRKEAFQLADRLQSDLNKLKGNYDYVLQERDAAMSAKFTCPSTGQIGDVVVPIEVLRSMFNVRSAPVAGPRPARAASAVR